jgi:Tfp pilus assembly protein PilO
LRAQVSASAPLQAELQAATNRAETLHTQSTRERRDAAKQLYDARKALRNALATPAHPAADLAELQGLRSRVAEQDQELEALRAQLATTRFMPGPVLEASTFGSALEALSFTAYARQHGAEISQQPGNRIPVFAGQAELLASWRREVTDHQQYLRSLPGVRAVLRVGAA